MHLEQVRRFTEETGARPVAHDVRIGRCRQQRALALAGGRLARGEQSHEPVRRRPLRGVRIEQQPLAAPPVYRLGIGRGELIEGAVVELGRNFDQPRHATDSLPIR